MKTATFEEREYETPLYHQLESDNRLWAPGQVLEFHVGFDAALYTVYNLLWQIQGRSTPPPGLALSRYSWFDREFMPPGRKKAPNFRLNLFLQAKRPKWGARPSPELKKHGFTASRYWKFEIDQHQQGVLERLSKRVGNKALIAYAAAAFDQHNELYRHTRKGSIAENSTFPNVDKLMNHSAWYYQSPGANADGVASSTPTRIREPPLSERIDAAIDASRDEGGPHRWEEHLSLLASAVETVLEEEDLEETAQRARYFDFMRRFRNRFENKEGPIQSFVRIVTFVIVYDLSWFVLEEV